MRSGRMLAEDQPSILLNKYNQTVCLYDLTIQKNKDFLKQSLENVFLQLCYDDQNRLEEQNLPINSINQNPIIKSTNQKKPRK